jgi:hypothetical protein
MIQDSVKRGEIEQEWHYVRRAQSILEVRAVAAFGRGGPGMVGVYDEYYALLLVLGVSVLEHALREFKAQHTIKPKKPGLAALLLAAEDAGILKGFYDVDAARQARNGLAHENAIPTTAQTFKFLADIEGELIGWSILPCPVKHQTTLSVRRTS